VRKGVFIATVLIAAAFGPAYAADLPGRPDPSPIMMVPVFNWTGFYLGGVVGGRWGKVDDGTGAGAASISGLTGGIIGGGNFQTGNFVFGIEADGGSGTSSGSNIAAVGIITSFDVQATVHLRARAGYAYDRFLVFGAAGYVGTELEITRTDRTDPNTLTVTILKAALNGWTAGGGVDYAPWNRFILRAEYLYESYSDRTFSFSPTVCTPIAVCAPIAMNNHVFRGAAMVKF
jgi:outer membrane immunogenic protein